jgi:hypothetical protein
MWIPFSAKIAASPTFTPGMNDNQGELLSSAAASNSWTAALL